jgi:L-glutamine-phosphate cytidylyltransferase
MHAIVLAAGQGTRLRPHTDHIPKAMVKLDNIPLLQRQQNVFRTVGINQLAVVTGYKEDKIDLPNLSKYYNPRFACTNMVASLYEARTLFDGSDDVIIAYGDIVYEEKVLRALMAGDSPLCVVIDKGWQLLWETRMENVLEDAETLKLTDEGFISEIGKKPKSIDDIQGQYIGLIKVAKDFAPSFFQLYDELRGKDQLFDGKDHDNMYMTTYLQLLINQGINTKATLIQNGWLEVDTTQDLSIYEDLLRKGVLDPICQL